MCWLICLDGKVQKDFEIIFKIKGGKHESGRKGMYNYRWGARNR